MAQFDIYRNPNKQSVDTFPYLLDIQNDILSSLKTRVVVPLALDFKPIKHLQPTFEIEGQKVVMLTSEIAGIPSHLCGEVLTNISQHRNKIIDALDFLVNGF